MQRKDDLPRIKLYALCKFWSRVQSWYFVTNRDRVSALVSDGESIPFSKINKVSALNLARRQWNCQVTGSLGFPSLGSLPPPCAALTAEPFPVWNGSESDALHVERMITTVTQQGFLLVASLSADSTRLIILILFLALLVLRFFLGSYILILLVFGTAMIYRRLLLFVAANSPLSICSYTFPLPPLWYGVVIISSTCCQFPFSFRLSFRQIIIGWKEQDNCPWFGAILSMKQSIIACPCFWVCLLFLWLLNLLTTFLQSFGSSW